MKSGGALEIYLADDDTDDRELFRETLKEIDHATNLTEFEDGDGLMKHLANTVKPPPPDIIFLDINMPRKGGKDCLREIRAMERFCNTPIIMFTTSSSPQDIDEAFTCGATLYIRKAYSMAEGLMTLKAVFDAYYKRELKDIPRNKFLLG